MGRRFVLLAVVALALVAEMALRPTRAQVRRAVRVAATRAPALVAPVAAPPPEPRSLDGTEVDGTLIVDARGDLVVSPEVRRFFEYFLAATGEEPDSVLRARIEAAIEARLPSRAARQARGLLGQFLAYREAARRLQASPSDDLATRIAAVREVRRKAFGRDVADALFGDEEIADDAALAHRGSGAPPPATAAEREAELRSSAFREGGAQRLEALDRARADWQIRLEAFRAERARVGEAGVSQLLDASFSAEEEVRVRALERIAGRPIP